MSRIPSSDRRARTLACAALVVLSLACALAYHQLIDLPYLRARVRFHGQFLSGLTTSPYQYQVLGPAILEGIRRLLAPGQSHVDSFRQASFLFAWGSWLFSLSALYRYQRLWFGRGLSVLGAACAASLGVLTMRDHFYHPWSYLEPGFYAVALRWMTLGRDLRCLAWMVPATLNRETAVFLVAAHAAVRSTGWSWTTARVRIPPAWKWTAAMALVWAAVFAGLRAAIGAVEPDVPVGIIWRHNLQEWPRAAWNLLVFLGPAAWLAARGFARAPRPLRAACWFLPGYAAAIAVFGMWYEIRMFLSFLTVLVPLALCAALDPAPDSDSARRAAETA